MEAGMSLLSGLLLRFRKATGRLPIAEPILEPASASGLNDLTERLNRWGRLWSPGEDESEHTRAQRIVTRRLTGWMERCFGEHMPASLNGSGDPISLASSMPVLTAFLGRRATRELSRRVLRDV
jgi:hypothetical protein